MITKEEIQEVRNFLNKFNTADITVSVSDNLINIIGKMCVEFEKKFNNSK